MTMINFVKHSSLLLISISVSLTFRHAHFGDNNHNSIIAFVDDLEKRGDIKI